MMNIKFIIKTMFTILKIRIRTEVTSLLKLIFILADGGNIFGDHVNKK